MHSSVARSIPTQLEANLADGTIRGGMALKVQVALDAAAAGVREVVIAGKARLLDRFPGTVIGVEPRGAAREATQP